MLFVLTHGKVMTPLQTIADGEVLIQDGKIRALGEAGTLDLPAGVERVDAGGNVVAPGFIDAHTHGGAGHDYMTAAPEQVAELLGWLPSTGVTGVLPTLASSPLDEEIEMLHRLRQVKDSAPRGAAILGFHLEGPFINPARRGAQPEQPIRPPSVAEMERLIEASGDTVRLVTLAPEMPGALELIRYLAGRGIVVSAGHSEAGYEEMAAAAEAGLTRTSHLYNGMPSFENRAPGMVGAALTRDDVYAELILDGIHVDPVSAELALRAKGLDKVVLVTDSTQAAGLGDGVYMRPANRKIIVKDGAARLENGSLAGSVLAMNRAVANAVRLLHLPLADALSLASRTAAHSLGLGAQKGTLAPGMDADLVVLGEDLQVRMAVVAGEIVYSS